MRPISLHAQRPHGKRYTRSVLLAKSSQPVRVLDELLWSIRRAGFAIATSQAIDVARAVRAIGYGDRSRMRDAIAAIVVTRARDRERFDAAFDGDFAREPRRIVRAYADNFAFRRREPWSH